MKLKVFLPAFLAVSVLSSVFAEAQTIPVNTKFGEVSDEELDMTVYPQDTTAAVVVLWKKREVRADFDVTGNFSRTEVYTERIKILKESGKNYPDYKINYSTDTTPYESVSAIKVWTWNRVDGKKTVDKLTKKMIFTEKVTDKISRVSFSAPNVQVGSVIEVSFTFYSPIVHDIGTIYLQGKYPINLAEASVQYAQCFTFNRQMRGYVHCDSHTEYTRGTLMLTGGASYDYNVATDYYTAVDVPAMQNVSHCYCPEFYMLSVNYDLRTFVFEDIVNRDFSSTWEKVDKQLRDESCVKAFYAKGGQKIADMGNMPEEQVIVMMRKTANEKIKWNDYYSIVPNVPKALKEGKGTTADINASFASALNRIGFTADPVFIRTRDKGMLLDYNVRSSAYTTVFTRVTTPSGKVYFIDAARDDGYLNVLPFNYLVSQARVIPLKGESSWADLRKLTRNQSIISVSVDVEADGNLKGTYRERGFNCNAASMKSDYAGYRSEEEYISDIENEDGIEIEGLQFSGNKDWSPDAELTYSWRSNAVVSGDFIYVKPFLSKFHSEAGFSDTERQIPIDFPYPHTINYSATISIPEGYTVESLPPMGGGKFQPAGSSFVIQAVYDGERTVNINYRFVLGDTMVSSGQYTPLREWWGKLVDVYNSTIVLKKI